MMPSGGLAEAKGTPAWKVVTLLGVVVPIETAKVEVTNPLISTKAFVT